jgi:hypothetical protein
VHSFVCLSSQTILLRQTRHKPACFDFSSSNFNVQGHILNTTVEALSDLYRKLHEMVGYLTNYQCYSIPVCHCHWCTTEISYIPHILQDHKFRTHNVEWQVN